MEYLKELIYIYKKYNWEYPASISQGKTGKLLRLAADASVQSEEELQERMYDDTEPNTGFRMLKFRVHEELLDKLSFHSYNWHHAHKNLDEVFQMHKRLVMARFLLLNGLAHEGYRIIRSVHTKAVKYQQPALQHESLMMLLPLYAEKGATRQLEECKEEMGRLTRVIARENQAEVYYQLCHSKIAQKKHLNEDEIAECREYINELNKLAGGKETTLRFRYLLARLQSTLLEQVQANQEQNALLQIGMWKGIEHELKKHTHLITPDILSDLSINLTKAYIYEGKYDEALKMLQFAGLYFVDNDQLGWFGVKQMEFIVLAWAGRIENAVKVASMVMKHEQFRFLEDSRKAPWYFIFMQVEMLGLLTGKEEGAEEVWKDSYLIDVVRKDKKGWNISLYLVEITALCLKKDFEEALHRLDAFRKYFNKYVNISYHFRVKCFYHILVYYVRHQDKKHPKLQQWLHQLEHEKPNLDTIRFEAIPYEVLCHYLLK